jgi:vacuolar-type H+-ATPase subunit I/STV1
MYRNDAGKLTVYATSGYSPKHRIETVKTAAESMAKQLNLYFEIIKPKTPNHSIYVYYQEADAEPVPVYCDEGKTGDPTEICSKMRSLMFVLSFHPKHASLKQARSTLMAFA